MGVSGPQGITATQPAAPIDPAAQADAQAQQAQMAQQQAPAAPAPKPPSMVPSDIAVLLAQSYNTAKLEAATHLATSMGHPRGSVNAHESDILRVWRKRNPDIDPLYEKFINKLSDEEIMYAMYPARRALIRYGRRTYTEQVVFAEHMNELDQDPRFADLDNIDVNEAGDEMYVPPQSKFPSRGQEAFKKKRQKELMPPKEE